MKNLKNQFEYIEPKMCEDTNDWSRVCKNHVDLLSINENMLDENGKESGQCAVKGCKNESDFYIDFV